MTHVFNPSACDRFILHGHKLSGLPQDYKNVIDGRHYETRAEARHAVHRLLNLLGLGYDASVEFAQGAFADASQN